MLYILFRENQEVPYLPREFQPEDTGFVLGFSFGSCFSKFIFLVLIRYLFWSYSGIHGLLPVPVKPFLFFPWWVGGWMGGLNGVKVILGLISAELKREVGKN